jgi:hypothetical protein
MSNAREYINSFTSDLGNVKDKWSLNAVIPFHDAYIDAFTSFKSTLKNQEDADKAEREWKLGLAMFALSLCGGGIMTAAFGTTVLKNIVIDKAVDAICNRNMEKAFRAAHYLATNKTANFVAGQVWDAAEKRATDYLGGKLKDSLAQNPAAYPSVDKFVQDPGKIRNALDTFILEAKTKCHDIAAAIRDNPAMTDDNKIAEVDKLRKSKIFNPPGKTIDNGGLAEDIELSFYMYMVMESDYQTSSEIYYVRSHDGLGGAREPRIKTHKHPVPQSVYAKDYPNDPKDPVKFNKIGGVIKDRMNGLYRRKIGGEFMNGSLDKTHLYRAEQTLDLLAGANIKRLIEAV